MLRGRIKRCQVPKMPGTIDKENSAKMVKVGYGLIRDTESLAATDPEKNSLPVARTSLGALCWELMRNSGGRGEGERKLSLVMTLPEGEVFIAKRAKRLAELFSSQNRT